MDAEKVLIMVPAFNEGRSVGRLVKELRALYPQYDVLVVNDGSWDETRRRAQEAGARVVSLPYNLGIGGAVGTGFKIADQENYDVAVQIDGDGQHDPALLRNVLEPVLTGQLDLCIGSRFLSHQSPFKSTYLRRIGIRFFSALLGLMTGVRLSDPTSGFRAVSKTLIPHFARYYPIDFPEPEAIQMANRFGAKIGEVPVNMRKRLGGISSIRYFSGFYYMVKVTFAILIDVLKKKK